MSIEGVDRGDDGDYVIELRLRNGNLVELRHPRWRTIRKRAEEVERLDAIAGRPQPIKPNPGRPSEKGSA